MERQTPPLFLGAVLLFWGWHHQLLIVAVCLCLIIESIHFFKFRFSFEHGDFNKFVDISIILLAAAFVIGFSLDSRKMVFMVLRWLPVICFPIIAAQQFSIKGRIDTRAFLLVGKKNKRRPSIDIQQINISYFYGMIVLISTGMVRSEGNEFYTGVALFFFWALWPFSSQRVSRVVWVGCFLGIVFSGFVGHQAIYEISKKTRMWMISYFASYYSVNPYKNSTALGDIGELKLSDVIVLRVKKKDGEKQKAVMLLQNATYNIFGTTTWYARGEFDPVEPGKDKTFWQINPPVANTADLTVYFQLIRKKAVLNLPPGVVSIGQMKVGTCEKNEMQAIRVEDGPSFIKAHVSYAGRMSYDLDPYERDLMVPKKERVGIQKIIKELDLENQPPGQILKKLKYYFASGYVYSLDLKGKGDYETPIQNFLHHTKAGHCEFFATAAALILRQLNIPARYVTGFMAHEYSRIEDLTVVRHRDAHAWVKVYINGRWENFDITPASSLQTDIQAVQISVVSDLFSFLRFKLFQLRHETGKKLMEEYGFWLILPLGIFLFFRLKKSNSIKRTQISARKSEKTSVRSVHEAFFLIEKLLEEKGYPKHPYETYGAWQDRVIHCFDETSAQRHFSHIISMYYNWRFSRSGIDTEQKIKFDRDIAFIIKKIKALS